MLSCLRFLRTISKPGDVDFYKLTSKRVKNWSSRTELRPRSTLSPVVRSV